MKELVRHSWIEYASKGKFKQLKRIWVCQKCGCRKMYNSGTLYILRGTKERIYDKAPPCIQDAKITPGQILRNHRNNLIYEYFLKTGFPSKVIARKFKLQEQRINAILSKMLREKKYKNESKNII